MNEKTSRILNIIFSVFTWIVVAFAVFMMVFTIISVNTVNKNDKEIFGARLYIVRTDSMSKSDKNANLSVHFDAGDIIFVKKANNPRNLNKGTIISFISTNSDSYGETITHMIRDVKKTTDGKVIGYVTYGTNTGVSDEALVEPEYILGVYAGKLPGMGTFFLFMKTTPGYILCVLVPFVLVIGYNVFNCIRIFMKYRKEQVAEIDAERSAIATQRQEAEEMRRQLEALQAQLLAQTGGVPVQPAQAPEQPVQPVATEQIDEPSVDKD